MNTLLNNSQSPLARMLVFSLPFMLVSLGLYFYSRPYTYVVRGEAAIICNDEKIYPAAPNNIEGVDALYQSFQTGFEDSSVRSADAKARKLCAYGVARDFIPFRSMPQERNYTIRLGTSGQIVAEQESGVSLSKE